MTVSGHLWQIAFGWLAVSTPWLVVHIVAALAPSEAAGSRAGYLRLHVATLIALTATAAVGLIVTPPSAVMAAADLVGFVAASAVAWPMLGDIADRSRAGREVDAKTRVASLRPRHVSDYLWPLSRAVPFLVTAIGIAGMALRLATPAGAGQRRWVAVACLVVGGVFLLLYHQWIHQEVKGGRVADPPDSDSALLPRVRSIYAWQVGLVVAFTTLGHLLLGTDWVNDSTWGMAGALAGGLLGVVGCARALASDLGARRYRRVSSGPGLY